MVKPYSLSSDEKEKTDTLHLRNFYPIPQYYSYINYAFKEIEKHNPCHLVIDLRDNAGGSLNATDSLLCYLTSRQYQYYNRIQLKINQYVKDKYKKRDSAFYHQIKDKNAGELLEIPVYPSVPDNQKNKYNGKISVLVNSRSYSGASTFANVVKQFNIGKVIGEDGGTDTYFGDFLVFNLPNSKLQVAISTKKFQEYQKAEPEKPTSREN